MKYEDMQAKFDGHINSPTEHELWNYWVAKDEDYRLARAEALLGWGLAIMLAIILVLR